MSRSGYSDDGDDTWALVRWRGAVASAFRGARGQAFLREMAAALDAMPVKELIAHEIVTKDGACCAMGAVAKARGCPTADLDAYNRGQVAERMGIAEAMCAEIAFENDDDFCYSNETPAQRWSRMRRWVDSMIITEKPKASP